MRYSNVSRKVWNDARFRGLSDSAKLLWLRLLTGPELTNVPGLFPANDAQLAKAMGWTQVCFSKAYSELSESYPEPLVKADWSAGLVWIPKAVFHNKPQSVNVVKSWVSTIQELPECELKTQACRALVKYSEKLTKSFRDEFKKLPVCFSKASPIQEQEQEQEQEIYRGGSEDGPSSESSDPPEPKKKPKPRKWTTVPDEWQPTTAHRDLAGELGVNFDAALKEFRDHEFKDPKSDADRAFRNWIRRNKKFQPTNKRSPPVQRGLAPGAGPVYRQHEPLGANEEIEF